MAASYFYTFQWEEPAGVVYVTGTFDGWSRSQRLAWTCDGIQAKRVKFSLPEGEEKVLYKFVVDGVWRTHPNQAIETEQNGTQNNVLYKHQLERDMDPTFNSASAESSTAALAAKVPKEERGDVANNAMISSAAPNATSADLAGLAPLEREKRPADEQNAALLSSASPDSTTARLAGEMPTERETNAFISSAAPDSTTAQLAGQVEPEDKTPQLDNVPGFFPETPATERENPVEQKDEANQVFSVNPLPASDTAENPITLKPGEPVPRDVTSQTLTSNVKLDKASYEAGATNYPVGNILLPDVVTPADVREREGRGVLDFALPPVSGNMIPESSLPIAEKKVSHDNAAVPGIVRESQKLAHADPEGSEVPETVEHKHEVEEELQHEVPVVPAAVGEDSFAKTATDTAHSAANTTVGAAKNMADTVAPYAAVAAQSAKDTASNAADYTQKAAVNAQPVVENAAQAAKEAVVNAAEYTYAAASNAAENAKPVLENAAETAKNAAYTAADYTQSAAATTAEYAKPAAENTVEATKSAVNTTTKATQGTTRAATDNVASLAASAGLSSAMGYQPLESESEVPEIVKSSQEEANEPPEASAVPSAVENKADVEKELKAEVPTVSPTTGAGDGSLATQAQSTFSNVSGSITNAATSAAVATGLVAPQETKSTPSPVSAVPNVVKDSMAAAGTSPEAAANQDSVLLKENYEDQLTSTVPHTEPTESSTSSPLSPRSPSPAPEAQKNATYILNQAAPVVTDGVKTGTTEAKTGPAALDTPTKPLKPAQEDVPATVVDSYAAAGTSAEAASQLTALHHKETVESELKKEVTPTKPAAASETVQAVPTSGIQDVKSADTTRAVTAVSGTEDVHKNGDAVKNGGHPKHSTSIANGSTIRAVPSTEPTGPVSGLVAEEAPPGPAGPVAGNGHAAGNGTTEPKTAAPVQPQPIHTSAPAKKSEEGAPASGTSPTKKRRSFFGKLHDKLHLRKKST